MSPVPTAPTARTPPAAHHLASPDVAREATPASISEAKPEATAPTMRCPGRSRAAGAALRTGVGARVSGSSWSSLWGGTAKAGGGDAAAGGARAGRTAVGTPPASSASGAAATERASEAMATTETTERQARRMKVENASQGPANRAAFSFRVGAVRPRDVERSTGGCEEPADARTSVSQGRASDRLGRRGGWRRRRAWSCSRR